MGAKCKTFAKLFQIEYFDITLYFLHAFYSKVLRYVSIKKVTIQQQNKKLDKMVPSKWKKWGGKSSKPSFYFIRSGDFLQIVPSLMKVGDNAVKFISRFPPIEFWIISCGSSYFPSLRKWLIFFWLSCYGVFASRIQLVLLPSNSKKISECSWKNVILSIPVYIRNSNALSLFNESTSNVHDIDPAFWPDNWIKFNKFYVLVTTLHNIWIPPSKKEKTTSYNNKNTIIN